MTKKFKKVYSQDIGNPKMWMYIYLSLFILLLIVIGVKGKDVLFKPWTARFGVTSAAIGENIYLFGGYYENQVYFDDIYRMNLQSKKLKHIDDLPSKRVGMSPVTIGEDIYLLGGFNKAKLFDEINRYNPKTKELKVIGKFPTPIAFGGAVLFNQKIIYVGGWDGKKLSKMIYQIDPSNGTVTMLSELLSPREYFSLGISNEKLYTFGGEDDNANDLNEICEVDIDSGKLTKVGQFHTTKLYTSVETIDQKFYLFGGNRKADMKEIIEVEIKAGKAISKIVAELPIAIKDISLVKVGMDLYAIGGVGDKSGRQIGIYHFSTKNYQLTPVDFSSSVIF